MNHWAQLTPLRRIVISTTILIACIALLLLGGILYRYIDGSGPSPLPDSVANSIPFSPLVIPDADEDFQASNYKYALINEKEEEIPLLSFTVTSSDNRTRINATQQPQPVQYSEIPEYKNQFLSNVARQYATVQSSNGTIYLGRLSKQNDKQVGIMIERGLLVFFYPTTGDVDDVTWRKLGDALQIQKL